MLTKEEVKRLVLEKLEINHGEDRWKPLRDGSEYLVDPDGWNLGVTISDTEIRLLDEAEPGYKKIPYVKGKEAIKEAITHFAEEVEDIYDPDNPWINYYDRRQR